MVRLTGRPVVAVLLDRRCQDQVLSEACRGALESRFEVRWPAGEGPVTPEEAKRLLAGARGALTGWGSPRLTAEVLGSEPALKVLVHSAGTVKPLVSGALWDLGVAVSSAAAVIAEDVAHYAVALMVMGRKNAFELSGLAARGSWGPGEGHRPPEDLRGAVVGVVAASHVGREVMALLRAYGVTLLLHDPFVSGEEAANLGAEPVGLDDLFRRADVVSLHAPDLPETRRLVNAARLESMRDGAVLINTARGGLVDEAALAAELLRRRIWAFLDVTDPEPPGHDSPLRGCPNLTLTPHVAGTIGRGRLRLGDAALEELTRFFAGDPLRRPVARERLERSA